MRCQDLVRIGWFLGRGASLELRRRRRPRPPAEGRCSPSPLPRLPRSEMRLPVRLALPGHNRQNSERGAGGAGGIFGTMRSWVWLSSAVSPPWHCGGARPLVADNRRDSAGVGGAFQNLHGFHKKWSIAISPNGNKKEDRKREQVQRMWHSR